MWRTLLNLIIGLGLLHALGDSPPGLYPFANDESPPEFQPLGAWDLNNASSSTEQVSSLSPNDTLDAVRLVNGNKTATWSDWLGPSSAIYYGFRIAETFDDNIFIQPRKVCDCKTQLAPRFYLQMGDKREPHSNFLQFIAQPSAELYVVHPNQDSINNYCDLSYEHRFTRLTLGLEQRYDKLAASNIDIGDLVDRSIYTTVATAKLDVSNHSKIVNTLSQNITDYKALQINTKEWIEDGYVLYQVTPRTNFGFGPRIGWIDSTLQRHQSYQDGLLRFAYDLTSKFKFRLIGGMELRQYQDQAKYRYLPVYDGYLDYFASEKTTLILESYRRLSVSYSEVNQDFIDTLIALKIKRALSLNLNLQLQSGLKHAEYLSLSSQKAGSQRQDNYYFYIAGLEWHPALSIVCHASYQYAQDLSTFRQSSFSDNQVSWSTSITF